MLNWTSNLHLRSHGSIRAGTTSLQSLSAVSFNPVPLVALLPCERWDCTINAAAQGNKCLTSTHKKTTTNNFDCRKLTNEFHSLFTTTIIWKWVIANLRGWLMMQSVAAVTSSEVSADAAFWHGNDWKFLMTSQQHCTLSWLWGLLYWVPKQLEHIIRISYWSIFRLDSRGQWLILVIHSLPTKCHNQQSHSSQQLFSLVWNPQDSHRRPPVAQTFNLHYIDLSVWLPHIQYNLVPVTPHSARLITLPFASTGTLTSRSRSALPIWIFDMLGLFIFFSRALFTICTGLTESVQAGFNGTSQSDGYKWIFLKQTKLEFALNEVTDCQICFGKAYRVRGAGGSKSPTVSWVYYEEIALTLFAKIKVSFFCLLLGVYWYL